MTRDDFCEDRRKAAESFAQTMIVVDDEATLETVEDPVPNVVVRPERGHRRAAENDDAVAGKQDVTHVLDAKSLVDGAMDIGLVCSVLHHRHGENQNQLTQRVLKAAARVDIVCLDWEIHGDSGATTCSLIREIVRHDQERNGRLRLIAIYTGERGRRKILNDIKTSWTPAERSRMKLSVSDRREIRSVVGLKIVCLFKKHGTRLQAGSANDQISESELPDRLLQEFSKLSEGLLSNVALGTVAKIRDVTHQVVGSFSGDMDGPYFHHRASIPVPDEAEEYAVNLVLSELASATRLRKVGRDLAGQSALERRVQSIAGERNSLKFIDENDNETDIQVNDVIEMILNGYRNVPNLINVARRPGNERFKKSFTSLFAKNSAEANMLMKKFAALTGTRSHPDDYAIKQLKFSPELGLGTIVLDPKRNHWLCLQASCDSVRLETAQAFLFVPLKEEEKQPEHVVPCGISKTGTSFIGLRVPDKGYTKVASFEFEPDPETKTVLAVKNGKRGRLNFKSVEGQKFIWIADLKQRRALRTASAIGQHMSRSGFDEFEPFRA